MRALLLVVLACCATPVSSLGKVRAGQTREQVVQLLGEPESTERRDGVEIWRYRLAWDEMSSPNTALADLYDFSFSRDGELFDWRKISRPQPEANEVVEAQATRTRGRINAARALQAGLLAQPTTTIDPEESARASCQMSCRSQGASCVAGCGTIPSIECQLRCDSMKNACANACH